MKRSNGFTLVELAIVILIAGLLIGLFTNFLTNFNVNLKQKKAQSDLQLISEAMLNYLNANGKLPCPASNTNSLSDENFGREVNADCTAATTADGVAVTTGTGTASGRKIVIGSVPVRSINIPDENMIDPWGSRYLYAVTAKQAKENEPYLIDNGAISVVDAHNHSSIDPDDRGAYVILSHGADRIGGYSLSGAEILPCSTSQSANERENCDQDSTFLYTLTSSSQASNFFDDLVVYQTGKFLSPNTPSGAVVAFDLEKCPPGWQDYLPGIGRSIIGAGSTTKLLPAGGVTSSSFSSGTFQRGVAGGSQQRIDSDPLTAPSQSIAAYENRPPYVPLLYCKKN